jgi:hypothetical protein
MYVSSIEDIDGQFLAVWKQQQQHYYHQQQQQQHVFLLLFLGPSSHLQRRLFITARPPIFWALVRQSPAIASVTTF